MSAEDKTLEAVLASAAVFFGGYGLVLAALFSNSPLLLLLGAGVLLISYALTRRIDPVVRRSCAGSGLVSILLVGLVVASLYLDATFTVKLSFCWLHRAASYSKYMLSGYGESSAS